MIGFFWLGFFGLGLLWVFFFFACRKVRTFARHFILVRFSLYLSYFLCLLEAVVNEDVQRSKC